MQAELAMLCKLLDRYGEDAWSINTMDEADLTSQLTKLKDELIQLRLIVRSLYLYNRLSAERRIDTLVKRIAWIEHMLKNLYEDTVIDFQI